MGSSAKISKVKLTKTVNTQNKPKVDFLNSLNLIKNNSKLNKSNKDKITILKSNLNAKQPVDSLETQKASNYKSQIEILFRSMVGCEDTGPCSQNATKNDLVRWLTNSSNRRAERQGYSTLTFDDFASLKLAYGNALGHYMDIRSIKKSDGSIQPVVLPIKVFFYPDDTDIIVNQEDQNEDSREISTLFPEFNHQRVSVEDYSTRLATIMSGNSQKITMSQFVNFIVDHKQRPDIPGNPYVEEK